ncbi:unnamed protein product [Rotaria magnacalcarata]|uniref:Uncharacterized protein n=2 Tax=Rotaria magnacalcarata TaxID=392030 RepID=A0A816W737_9BILA|nr:unnamed protein product [Rotaria magnacalcarata]
MMNHSSPNEPSLDSNDGEINLDQLLSAEIQITSQPLMTWSTTTRIPSQKSRNPNSALHPIVTTRQLARRRYRQRRQQQQLQQREELRQRQLQETQRRRQQQQRDRQRQQQREQNETPIQQQQRQQRQQERIQRQQVQQQERLQRQQEQRQERERQRQQRQSTPIIANRHRYRSDSDIEREHQYYLSRGFSEDLDNVDPHEHLQLLELESMNPIERAAHEQLEQYEQSLRPQPSTSLHLNIEHSVQYQTGEELLQAQQVKQDELERHVEVQLLILQQDQLEQSYQIQAVERLEEEENEEDLEFKFSQLSH